MIHRLTVSQLGPIHDMPTVEFGRRLNLFTGDNGLGKSFLLDLIWYALTRKWPAEVNPRLTTGTMALPRGEGGKIRFEVEGGSGPVTYEAQFNREIQAWVGKSGRPVNAGLVLYAMVDGSFAVWDPHRNYWRKSGSIDAQDRQPAYVFSAKEVWDGLRSGDAMLCNGLLSDWANWQRENGRPFERLTQVLKTLASQEFEGLAPGELRRFAHDARAYPTLRMPYGLDVPLNQLSAGMRRIFSLAYLLVWAWEEHLVAGELMGKAPTSQITFLVDEMEAHLHPRWQRTIVPALLDVMKGLSEAAEVQLITATHSPMLLTSIEPLFDPERDRWFDLDLVPGTTEEAARVELRRKVFERLGDAGAWLRSDAFDLSYDRSVPAEHVLNRVEVFLKAEADDGETARALNQELLAVLPPTDPFWVRWNYVAERRGWSL